MIILSREDFRDLSIGNISKHPYSPAGEYHLLPDPAYAGRWEEANVSSRWRSGTGCWKVVPEGGRRVMEQTLLEDTETPLMVTGSRFWDDYVASVEIRPLSWARPFGLVVRYVHSRRYYFLALSQDHVAFVKRDHDEEIVLAKARWRGSVDRYYRVSVGCKGDGFRATVLTPWNWTPTLLYNQSRKGDHHGKATKLHARVQGPGGAGAAQRQQEHGRSVPGAPACFTGSVCVEWARLLVSSVGSFQHVAAVGAVPQPLVSCHEARGRCPWS